ncbi:hypothetical protein TWF225_000314 [Orbilia oligospora]|uniref:Uncharacterized protein n=1 Tax=Orbilia oligospora TaxID=2813651 RepID=A0A7C8PXW6_ORBOL|nr:hypothetical protein TWF751_004351 [Orbilia oligospora]KAF3195957.1 hypothetical protein TWF225_000314 [Orbilia oligospora]KAF3266543.1 hypothetical protein TWF128_010930 [Orbilia oligospora]KAF3272131.1 hypothetical protein TWF217_003939 [Orbilia oligospora]KAF3297700.1 hypothetical protein TWF132_006104 [Orbilia oligospora]
MQLYFPFIFHSLLEIPPSLLLLFSPLSFVPHCSPRDANSLSPILRQYGAILLSSSLVSFFLSITPDDIFVTSNAEGWTLHKLSAVSIAFYHIFPIYRALKRVQGGEKAVIIPFFGTGGKLKGMGGPGIHLITHLFVGGALLRFALLS